MGVGSRKAFVGIFRQLFFGIGRMPLGSMLVLCFYSIAPHFFGGSFPYAQSVGSSLGIGGQTRQLRENDGNVW